MYLREREREREREKERGTWSSSWPAICNRLTANGKLSLTVILYAEVVNPGAFGFRLTDIVALA